MPRYFEIARDWVASIRSRDTAVSAAMLRRWVSVEEQLAAEIDAVAREIERRRSAGQEIGVSWFLRSDRLQSLRAQVVAEIRRFADYAGGVIVSASNDTVAESVERGIQLFEAARPDLGGRSDALGLAGMWNRLPVESFERMVGVLEDGSPVLDHLRGLAPTTFENVAEAFRQAMAKGWNPRKTARAVKEELGLPMYRAEANSRTSQMRASREASRAGYEANAHLVQGWVWYSALDSRTCPICWSQHGSFHELSEPMGSHVNCRCTMIPYLKGTDVVVSGMAGRRGQDLFDELDPAQQKEILGPARYELYVEQGFELREFVASTDHPVWGPGLRLRTLREIDMEVARLPAPVQMPAVPDPIEYPDPVPVIEASGYQGKSLVDTFGADGRSEVARLRAQADAASIVVSGAEKRALNAWKRTGVPAEINQSVGAGAPTREADVLAALMQRSGLSDDLVLYRGARIPGASYQVGDVITGQPFDSFSSSLNVAKRFAGADEGQSVIFELQARKGEKAIPIDALVGAKAMKTGGEFEYIVDGAGEFEVLGVEEIVWRQSGWRKEEGNPQLVWREDFESRVKKVTIGRKVPAVLDGVGAPAVPASKPAIPSIGEYGLVPSQLAKLEAYLRGRGVSAAEFVHGMGASTDDEVKILDGTLPGQMSVVIRSSDWTKEIERIIDGDVVSHEIFTLRDTGKGDGTRIFADQVSLYRRLGLKTIKTDAVAGGRGGGRSWNGYYTWPRLGFDVDLTGSGSPAVHRIMDEWVKFDPSGAARGRLLDLMATKEGRELWKRDGVSVLVEFDLDPGSRSSRILDAYLAERAKGAASVPSVLADAVAQVAESRRVAPEDVLSLPVQDFEVAARSAREAVGDPAWWMLTQERRQALIADAYNTGVATEFDLRSAVPHVDLDLDPVGAIRDFGSDRAILDPDAADTEVVWLDNFPGVVPLDPEIEAAVEAYKSGHGFKVINGELRAGEDSAHATAMDAAFVPAPEPVMLYRGVNQYFEIPDDFVDNGFVSGSLNVEVAESFAGADGGGEVIAIEVLEGSLVLPVDHYGLGRWESEVILPRGTRFVDTDRRTAAGQRIFRAIPQPPAR